MVQLPSGIRPLGVARRASSSSLDGVAGMCELSKRESEVLEHLRLGLTNRQIAERLFVSTNTVNKHVHQVLRKLNVRNRVQAAIQAQA